MDLLYNETTTVGRLASYFSKYFPKLTERTRHLLLWLLIAMLALGGCPSIRFLFRHFLKDAAPASQNCYYRACKHRGIDFQQIVKTNVQTALAATPKELRDEPIFLSVDDTTIAKFGKKFEDAALLFDHSDHTGHPYVNGHCFVSLTICVPAVLVARGISRIHYVSVPVGYAMWKKDGGKSKLELAADLLDVVMPELDGHQVILSFDSWYAKKPLLERTSSYRNLSIVTNVRSDTAMYERRPAPTGKRGRPRKHGAKISLNDFDCRYRMGDYLVGCRRVLTNLFGERLVYAYVTQSKKGTRRLFLSTIRPYDLRMSCAWQESRALRQAGPEDMVFYPLRLYGFRWHIEINYYEQKMFWSLKEYRLRSRDGIEHLVNLVNIAHAAMRILPYVTPEFRHLRGQSAQEVRSAIGRQIRKDVFFAKMDLLAQTDKNSNHIQDALKWMASHLGEAA